MASSHSQVFLAGRIGVIGIIGIEESEREDREIRDSNTKKNNHIFYNKTNIWQNKMGTKSVPIIFKM